MKRSLLLLTLVCICIYPKPGLSATISATPHEGGSNLSFGRVDAASFVNKEVRIRTNPPLVGQYQVFQRVARDFLNERGRRMNPEVITASTLRGSNASGTLYANQPLMLSYRDDLLYTSSPNGPADTFLIVYSIRGDRLDASGEFWGQIVYTFRPIGGGLEEQVYLDVYIDASGELNIETEASSGKNFIKLSTAENKSRQGYVKFSFTGNIGTLKIYQEMTQLAQNDLRRQIDKESIKFSTLAQEARQAYYRSPSVLEQKRLLIYSCDSPEDVLVVNFLIDEKAENQAAGRYRTEVVYSIETEDFREVIPVELEIEVSPIFTLETTLPLEGMHFSNLLPNSPPQEKAVTVKVKTNLARPYIVSQNLSSALVNEKGNKIPLKFFTIKEKVLKEQPGKVESSAFTPIRLGEMPLFFSDAQGSPSEFIVIYRLTPFPEIFSGDYSTQVNYSLGEK